LGLGLVLILVAAYVVLRPRSGSGHFIRLREYWADPEAHADWAWSAGESCAEAPFLLPTDGFVAWFWGSARRVARHQGLDIFGPSGPDGLGQTPVVAAYDGFLTRMADWRSAVIIRIPQDPLQPGRQIWTYYTHMADAEGNSFIEPAFPPGSREVPVRAGTLLGYQGNYSGDSAHPTGMHLHFSIVLDDGDGRFRNELEIANTIDPSPYLGIEVNAERIEERNAVCDSNPSVDSDLPGTPAR
jgi:murein DD-endopeptidase MepM/ murein hydrolase activator NlpD